MCIFILNLTFYVPDLVEDEFVDEEDESVSLQLVCTLQKQHTSVNHVTSRRPDVTWRRTLTRSSMPTMYLVSAKGPISSQHLP